MQQCLLKYFILFCYHRLLFSRSYSLHKARRNASIRSVQMTVLLGYPLKKSDTVRSRKYIILLIFVMYCSHKLCVKVIQSSVFSCRNNVRCPGL